MLVFGMTGCCTLLNEMPPAPLVNSISLNPGKGYSAPHLKGAGVSGCVDSVKKSTAGDSGLALLRMSTKKGSAALSPPLPTSCGMPVAPARPDPRSVQVLVVAPPTGAKLQVITAINTTTIRRMNRLLSLGARSDTSRWRVDRSRFGAAGGAAHRM